MKMNTNELKKEMAKNLNPDMVRKLLFGDNTKATASGYMDDLKFSTISKPYSEGQKSEAVQSDSDSSSDDDDN